MEPCRALKSGRIGRILPWTRSMQPNADGIQLAAGDGVDRFDIFEFLDRIEDYHPSHLVAWLQSRLVTIEELPAMPIWPASGAQEVSRAYEILTDPAQREAHDQERLRRAAALEEAALRTLKLRFRPSRDVASDFGRDLENLTGRAREVLWSAMGSLHSMVAVLSLEFL
eukprot:g144.t1